jgi:hypothetical protein
MRIGWNSQLVSVRKRTADTSGDHPSVTVTKNTALIRLTDVSPLLRQLPDWQVAGLSRSITYRRKRRKLAAAGQVHADVMRHLHMLASDHPLSILGGYHGRPQVVTDSRHQADGRANTSGHSGIHVQLAWRRSHWVSG